LDVTNACLWRGKKRTLLTPKDFAVLHHLVTHAGQLVTHDELFKALWPGATVSQGVLKVCLRRIRQELRDSPAKPRFIETKHRQGYRFIAPVVSSQQSVAGSEEQSKVQSLGSSVQKEAEKCFHKAIEIARRQSAKSLELRAVMSLARLPQRQGKKKQARRMLAEIYGWFTEGFETKDLQEAKALSEELH
jgi:DNA-binding winged helix-turn-helix (wHTH) protein